MQLQAQGRLEPTEKTGGGRYFLGDPIPVAYAVEDNSEAAWAQWSHAEMELDAVLASGSPDASPGESPAASVDARLIATPVWLWMRMGR